MEQQCYIDNEANKAANKGNVFDIEINNYFIISSNLFLMLGWLINIEHSKLELNFQLQNSYSIEFEIFIH